MSDYEEGCAEGRSEMYESLEKLQARIDVVENELEQCREVCQFWCDQARRLGYKE